MKVNLIIFDEWLGFYILINNIKMQQTSRWRLLDSINLICEEIALASHCQELINTYRIDIESASDSETIKSLSDKIEDQEYILEQSIKIRRDVMSNVYDTYKWDHNLRCEVKHSIWAYQYATECLYANQDDWKRKYIQQLCYEKMIWILSKFCGVDEFITCSRCLEEILQNGNSKKIIKESN